MKSFLRCLTLIAALCVGWATNAQVLDEFVYSTGIDSTKWVTLTTYNDLSGTGSGDGWRSSVQNIGFNFPFGDEIYTQYSVNSDGNLRLGSTQTGTSNYSSPFSSSNSNVNNPKINFFGCDGYLVSGTHFVYTQNFGDTLLVVEYCLGPFSSTYRNNQFHWQVHLYSSGKIEVVFASASNLSSSNSHQMGLCISATDGWIINSSNVATHFTNGSTTSWTSTTWPTPYTYYTFELPNTTCPRPSAIAASNVTATTATVSFTPAGTETSWLGTITPGIMGNNQLVLTDTVVNLMMLTPNTEYTVSIRAICGDGDTSTERQTTFHTDCVPMTLADLPYTEDFEAYGTGSANPIGYCWTKGTNGSTAYPYPYSTAAINGSRGLYFYGYKPSSASGTLIYSYAAMPELASSVDVSGLTLRFNMKRYSNTTAYYRTLMLLGVMTDPTDITTFDTIDTYNITNLPGSTVVNVERELSDYTGTGRYIAFLVPPVDTNTSYTYNYVYLDDVELMVTPSCRRPTSLTIANITSSSAELSWTPGSIDQDTFAVAYGTGTNPDSMTSVVVTGTNLTMSTLDPATQYNVFVKAVCSSTDESEWSAAASFTTMQIPVAVTTANFFEDDFEGDVNWLMYNDANNKWFIGNAVNNGGERSLYITNNSGVSNAYGTSTVQWSYAQKAFSLNEGQYVVSFDWQCNGESNYDYMRVFLVPASVTLAGGLPPVADAAPYSFRSTTPAGWISLDNSSKLNLQTSWLTRVDTATITTAGVYNLVFLWTNDASGGSQPPAAVDNVKIVYKPANATMVTFTNANPTMGYTIPEPGNYYYAAGDTIRAAAMPYNGYQFEYWIVDAGLIVDSITVNPFAEVVPAYMANMTINATALFSARTYTLNVVSNNTLLGTVTGSGTYTYLDTVTITATPNSGFRFLGWNDGDTNTTRTIVVTSDSTFTAIFDYQPVTVTLSVANPSMGTTVPAPGTYTFSVGDTMRATAIPNQYHRFVSWTLSALGMSESVTMNPVSEIVPLFLAGMNFNITCNFEEYHLPAFDSIYDFENAAADSVWTLVNGTVTNQWVIDTAISNGGSRSLYISNDGGSSNAYTTSSTSFAYAELGGWMEPGIYNISYDWKAYGESNYDYIRAFLAPIDYVFTAGQTPIGTTSANGFINTVPEGLIPLDGGTKKNLSSSFSTYNNYGIPIATRGEYKIVFMWANDGSGGSQPPAAIDNIVVETPTCPPATSLTASDITANSAVLSWFAMPDVTSYVVEYGYDTTAATMAMIAGNSTTITGLIDNTTYYFRVMYTCDGNVVSSDWYPFTTLCSAIAPNLLPYSENFDSYTTSTTAATGIEPDCWTLAHRDVAMSSNTYLPQIYYNTSNAHSSSYSLRLYYRCIYALPAIDTNISVLQMGFWVKQTSSSYRLIVGVMSDLEDETTFVPVDTIINSSTSAPEYHEVLFSNYTGNGHYIAFRNYTTASYNYSYNYIDDVVVDLIPTCPAPTGVTAELVNASTAIVSWTPYDSTQNIFEVAYGTGTNPDSMLFVYSNTASATITGLAPETNYNIYVSAICSPADVSPWSIPSNVYTGYCQPTPTSIDNQGITNVTFGTGEEVVNNSQRPTSAPYYGNYYTQVGAVQAGDSVNVDITYATGYTYGTIIWVDWNNNLTFDGNEVVYVGTAPNNNPTTLNASFEVPATQETGVYRMRIAGADSYYDSYTGSIAAAANANPCPTGSYTIVHDYSLHVLPIASEACQIVISGEDSYGDGWNGGFITISQNGSDIDTFTVDQTSTTDTIDVDNNYPVVFSWTSGAYDGEVSFTIQDGTGAYAYTCSNGSDLPDAVFYTMNTPCPSCFMPTVEVSNLGTTSATISWTDDNSGATYTVYNNNTVVATGITASTYTFTGLTENTNYTFGVVANCSASDASDMATVSVHTPCGAVAVPFYESFDTASVTLSCWTAYSMNTANDVSLSLFNGDGIALRFSSYNSASDYNQYAFSPVFNYTGNMSALNLTVQYATYGSDDHLWFGYITPTDTVWSTNYYTTTGQSDVQTYTANIPANATQIAFHYWGSYAYYAWIDSVSVTIGAACVPVTNLTVDSISQYSVSISWTGDGTSYTLYNDTTVVATGITDTNYTFTGLTASTDYTFGVQTNCPAGNPSAIVYVNAHTLAEPIMCGDNPANIIANADSATSTVNYFPAYSLYDYSYSEVIIPSERLTGLGIIKGMEFKPTNVTAGSSHMTNCDIYMMNTTATSLSDGFIQDTNNFQLVFSGNLNYDNTNWQTITFDSSFTWNGTDNVIVAVHRNDGSWASSGSFESFTASSQLARYIYRDNTPYTIGEITGGTATTNVPVYHLIGCETPCIISISGEDSYGDGWNGGYITVSQNGSAVETFTLSSGSTSTATISVSRNYPVTFTWTEGSYDDEVSFIIYDGSGAPMYTCTDGSNLPSTVFYTMNTPCPSCFAPTVTVDNYTNSSATISWTDDNSDATYTIYNDTTVVATGITTNTYTFTGLTGHTHYNIGVQANCSATDASSIIYVNFTTQSDPILCGTDSAMTFANADSATSTTSYFPGYSYYNYSYTEVIIPANRLTGLGEIKGMEFKPASTTAGNYFTNCEIYLMNTSATSLANGFIQDTNNLQLVYSGDLSYENTNWQTVTFDTSFTWNGTSNVLVAVRRNHGSWTSGSSFESFVSNDTLARYVNRDASAYTIGEITGGTATSNVPVYHLIGCEGQAPAGVTVNLAVNDTVMGTTVPAPGTYTFFAGDTMGAYAIANTGYHFDYWTVSVLGLTDTLTTNPIADIVPAYLAGTTFDINAYFAPNMYTITATSANTTMGTVTGGGSYAYGTTATLTATPATGYHFVQWNDADTHATRTVTVTGDATYTATFAYNPLTVTLAVNDTAMGTTTPAPGTYTFNVGDTVTATAIAATGHSFQTWVIPGITLPSLTDNPLSMIIPAEVAGMSINVTAQFTVNNYTINVVANDSTRGSVTGSGTYAYGTEVTITATPAQHYYLLQWSDGDTHLTRNITVTHDATYTAIFRALPQHTVTLNAAVGGTVTGSGVYYEGDLVTISAIPNEYYAFVSWVDPTNNVIYTEPTVTFPMSTTDIVLTALFEQVVFEATLDVTVNNIEWGHVLINGERADRYHGHTGDTVTLQAVAHDGYHFDHWDGVHPIDDTEIGETVTIVLTEPATDIQCYFAENVSIDDVADDNTIIYTKHNNIVVSGAEQQTIRVFDVVGRLVAQRSNAAVEETIPMPATGVYLVKVGDRPARRVVVRK